MSENTPGQVDTDDESSGRKPEIRAARISDRRVIEATGEPPDGPVPSDDAEVGSEPMSPETTLSRLSGDGDRRRTVPPGKQLSGDPPEA